MRVRLLASTIGEHGRHCSGSYLVNGVLAVDAGFVGFHGTPEDQSRIRHVVLSNARASHVASLPIFVENVYEGKPDCVMIHASDESLEAIRSDLFNDRVWPDFFALSTEESPFLRAESFEAGGEIVLGDIRVESVPIDHSVPTMAFIVADSSAAVAFVSDTGPTMEIWRRANETENLRAAFVEVSYPSDMASVAEETKQLTPATFAIEAAKLRDGISIVAVAAKPRHQERIHAELEALGLPNLELGDPNKVYVFG